MSAAKTKPFIGSQRFASSVSLTALTFIGAMCLTTQASAQSAPAPESSPAPAPDLVPQATIPASPENAAAAKTGPDVPQTSAGNEEIVITGSLIARPNNTAVSPIVTATAAAIKQSGQPTLQDALNQSGNGRSRVGQPPRAWNQSQPGIA